MEARNLGEGLGATCMDNISRHRCLIYTGPPSNHLAGLSAVIRDKLQNNYRCLYLNSPTMVAGIRSALAASGLNVADEVASGSLVLSSDQSHLMRDTFDPRRMLNLLSTAFHDALVDGYVGLWASGDMAWEFGPARDFGKLMEYERGLDEFLRAHPTMCGICQYHADVLPADVVRNGFASHPALYVNETLSLINSHYAPSESGVENHDFNKALASHLSRMTQGA